MSRDPMLEIRKEIAKIDAELMIGRAELGDARMQELYTDRISLAENLRVLKLEKSGYEFTTENTKRNDRIL